MKPERQRAFDFTNDRYFPVPLVPISEGFSWPFLSNATLKIRTLQILQKAKGRCFHGRTFVRWQVGPVKSEVSKILRIIFVHFNGRKKFDIVIHRSISEDGATVSTDNRRQVRARMFLSLQHSTASVVVCGNGQWPCASNLLAIIYVLTDSSSNLSTFLPSLLVPVLSLL